MILQSSLIVSVSLIVAVLAVVLFCANYMLEGASPKSRVARVRRFAKLNQKLCDDMPSIVRERKFFLRNTRVKQRQFIIIDLLEKLERLLKVCGYSCSAVHWLAGVFIISVFLSFIIVFFSPISFFVIFVPCSLAFLALGVHFLFARRKREIRRFQELFPDALDLMVRSVRAGLPVSEAIKAIATELAAPVNGAFREIASNLAIGVSLDEALAALGKKVPIAEVQFFTISLTIQQETGGNLAEILANLSSIMRRRAQIGKKIRALSSEARASAYIIGSLPFLVGLVIYVLNPDYIHILFFDSIGQLLLCGALFSVALGAIVIGKLIRFNI